MTTNGRPVIPPRDPQAPPNGTPPPPWAVPPNQPRWQQAPPILWPEPPSPEASGSLKLLWVITCLSGVLGVVMSSQHDAAKVAFGAGLLGYFGVSLLVTLAVQALRHR